MFMPSLLLYLGALLLSMVSGFIFIPIITRYCLKKHFFDIPDSRKIHKNPIPRLGGIAFVPSMLQASVLVLFFMNSQSKTGLSFSLWSLFFCISLFIIYFMGIIDDLIGLRAGIKFIIEIAATLIMPLSGLYINNLYGLFGIYAIPFWIGAPITILVMVFICNAMNLIDGIDGLSATLTMIALMGFLLAFHSEHLIFYCILIASLMGVLISYLYYNMFGSIEKKQKIFMGDSGSLSLGFILGFLAVKYSMDAPIIPYSPKRIMWSWTLLAIPCFDVIRVFFYRICHHHSPFHPDKNHIHHKLMACGLSQHKTLAAIVVLQLGIIAANVLLYDLLTLTIILLLDVAIYLVFIILTDWITSRRVSFPAKNSQIA